MTPKHIKALHELFADALEWLPPASATDDPSAPWRCVTAEEFRAYRDERDPALIERFAEILADSRRALERDMAESLKGPASPPALSLVPHVGEPENLH